MVGTIVEYDKKEKILAVLKYFAIFRYPLKTEEIIGHCSVACSQSEIGTLLEELLQQKSAFFCKGYYANSPNIADWVQEREQANSLAQEKILSAARVARFIFAFPFVEFVGISGSLSKGVADSKSDFDFFILTSPERLWIARSILHAFKKLTFLVGAQHRLCMNYFMDVSHPELEEKNIFTAVELSSMLPVCGLKVYEQFMRKNEWIKSILPNTYTPFIQTPVIKDKPVLFRLMELPFLPFAGWLNKKLMKLTDTKWRKKWARKNYPPEDYELAFRTTLYQSKNHPANHQKRTLEILKTGRDHTI
mgnify:CR=1 FL=1